MSKHKPNKQLTRGELQQRIRKETLELITNLNSAPVVLRIDLGKSSVKPR